jgi:hypothetical protein
MIDISVPAQSGQLDLAMDEADAVTCSVQAIAKTDNAQVGEVGACEVLDPTTKLVRLLVGRAVRVPLRMKEDFHGEFMVRAIDPVTQEILCSLELKTDYVE